MKVSKYFIIACAALMVSACADEIKDIIVPDTPKEEGSKEEDNEVVEMIPVTVTVTENFSRVSHDESGNKINVAWETDDVIYLGNPEGITTKTSINANGSGFSTLAIDASSISEDKKTASFTGEIPANLSGKTLLAFYGSAEKLKVSNSQVIMDFTQQTQSKAGLAHLKGYDLMSAVVAEYDGSSKINLQFKHEGVIFKVKLRQLPTDESISTVVLSLPEGTNSFVTSKSFNANGVASNGETTNSLELNVAGISNTDYDAVFTLCPTTLNSEVNISVPVTKVSGLYSYTDNITISNATLEAGKYYWTPELLLAQDNTIKGEGSSDNPYIIDNVEKFSSISGETGKFYSITQDMDFSGATITPIETFAGTLDGGNKTLSNITLNNNNATIWGLVKTNNGTIKNINFAGFNVTSGQGIASINIGGIVGENSGTIENIKIESGTFTTNSNKVNAGFITGKNTGTVKLCSLSSNTTISNTINEGASQVAGIVGWGAGGNIIGCSCGSVIRNNGQSANYAGIVAANGGSSTVTGCYYWGTADVIPGGSRGGGISAKNDGTIVGCYVSKQITGGNGKVASFVGESAKDSYTSCYCFYNNIVGTGTANGITKTTANELKTTFLDAINQAISSKGIQYTTNENSLTPLVISGN